MTEYVEISSDHNEIVFTSIGVSNEHLLSCFQLLLEIGTSYARSGRRQISILRYLFAIWPIQEPRVSVIVMCYVFKGELIVQVKITRGEEAFLRRY